MGAMKQCRECKAQIPADAKRCMHCGAKLRMGCLGWTVAMVFTLMVISIVSVEVSLPPDRPESASSQSAPAAADPSVAATSACVDALRNNSKFPSSFDFSPFTDPPQTQLMNDGSYLVRVDFSAKNGFGNTLPQAGHCTVKDGAVINIEVDPR